jgi:hypothetical protein
VFRYLQVNRHTLDYPRQLFGYAQNIADGMEYLTQVSSFISSKARDISSSAKIKLKGTGTSN